MGSSVSKIKPHIANVGGERIISIPHQHSSEHFNLLVRGFTRLRDDGSLCDITLCTNEADKGPQSKHRAHKCVLAATSGYFRKKMGVPSKGFEDQSIIDLANDEFTNESSESVGTRKSFDTITIEFPISDISMEAVLKYIYSAVLDTNLEHIQEVLEAAIKLEIKSLKHRCMVEIQTGFKLEYFQRVFRLSCKLDIPELREFALRRTIEKFDQFVDTGCFLNLNESEMQELANHRMGVLSSTCIIPELQLFNGILKWEKHDAKNRRDSALKLLKCLHYEKIPQSTLSGYVLTHDIVSKDKEISGIIEQIIGADKRKILQRLRDRHYPNSSESAPNGGLGDAPPPSRHALVVTGGQLFDQFTAQVQELNEKEGTWKEITRMPSTLSHHSVAVHENILYVAGGEDSAISGVRGLASLWSYDPTKNEWETLPEMQQARAYFHLGVLGNCLYASGGKSSNVIRTSVEKYCISKSRWEFSLSLKLPRYAHAGCNYKQNMFINGGVVRKSSSEDTLRFDTDSNHWHSVAPMRCSRSRHCMAAVRDRIYVFGGVSELQGVSQQVNIALECYTPQCDQWHKVALKVSFQSDKECGCAELGGHIYLVGGCRTNVTDHRFDVASYDPESDVWKCQPKLHRRLRGAACAVLALR